MISSLASKCQYFKLKGFQFHIIKWLKTGIPNSKACHFEACEVIMTKFKPQAVHIIKIKSPSLILALWKIAISISSFKYFRTVKQKKKQIVFWEKFEKQKDNVVFPLDLPPCRLRSSLGMTPSPLYRDGGDYMLKVR